MTRKEKDLKVLELFGLKVGDKIKTKENRTYVIVWGNNEIELRNTEKYCDKCTILDLAILDWEKLDPSLKDKKCMEFIGCKGCPFADMVVDCGGTKDNLEEMTLGEIYNIAKESYDKLRIKIFGEE